MRLSFSAAILIGTLALPLFGTSETSAQHSALPKGVEHVASPLANWQPEYQGNIAGEETTTVVVEVRSVAVDLDCDVPLKSFFKRGSFEVHTGSMPAINADTNVGASRVSNAAAPADSTIKMAAACESVRRAMPVMLAKLDDDGVVKISEALSNQTVTSAPTVVCYSGQTATISDVNLRPFVVGVKPIVGDVGVAHQPIIQTIEDGYMFQVNPVVKNGKIDLKASLAHSKISNVETFTVSGNDEAGVNVQIPEQTLKQVSLSASLENGETLFIDPRLQIEVEEKQTGKIPFKKSKSVDVKKQVYFLLTTRIVNQESELGARVADAK
jgi:hypothetical protein